MPVFCIETQVSWVEYIHILAILIHTLSSPFRHSSTPPAILLPYLYKRYTQQHTYRLLKPLHYCVMLENNLGVPPNLPVVAWDHNDGDSMWTRVQHCDYLMIYWVGGLVVASSIGCPAVVLPNTTNSVSVESYELIRVGPSHDAMMQQPAQ